MQMYEAIYAPISFSKLLGTSILADSTSSTGYGSTVSKQTVERIEHLINEGNFEFRRRRYRIALAKYKEARAEIYSLITPSFNIGSYLGSLKDFPLPLDSTIETKIIEAGLHLLDDIIAKEPPSEPIKWPIRGDVDPPPETRTPTPGDADLPIEIWNHIGLGLQEILSNASSSIIESGQPEASEPQLRESPSRSPLSEAVSRAETELRAGRIEEAKLALNEAYRIVPNEDRKTRATISHDIAVLHLSSGDTGSAVTDARRSVSLHEGIRDDVGAYESLALLFHIQSERQDRSADHTGRRMELLSRTRDLDSYNDARQGKPLDVWGAEFQTLLDSRSRTLLTDPATPPVIRNDQVGRSWSVGVPAGERIVRFPISPGNMPGINQIADQLYKTRIDTEVFTELAVPIVDTSTTSFYLTQLYAYVLTLKIGDTYHELGNYKNAEAYYLMTSKYSYLNLHIEATVVWIRLARNALEWATTLYKRENISEARAQFEKIIGEGGIVPSSVLYSTVPLKKPADEATTLIDQIGSRPLPTINPDISFIVLEAYGLLSNLVAGFDYYGLLLSPIHTFEYLQQISRSFCQQAIQAEREYVNFKSREEIEAATRRELENAAAMAEADMSVREELLEAAQSDALAVQRGMQLAVSRRNDAQNQFNAYKSVSWDQVWSQAASQALMGGSDAYYSEISELADQIGAGGTVKGDRPMLAAAHSLKQGYKTREYELAKMQDNIEQLAAAITVAQAQLGAAQSRITVAELALQSSYQQVAMTEEGIKAFDDEFFTPDAWARMAVVIREISRQYLYRAIRIAKLMERSYNFENDEMLKVIKSDYGIGIANEAPGRDTRLLGGDALLIDVESFTFHAITSTTRKTSRIKDVISLSSDYPAQFESFLNTGLLTFETDLYEFERLHPGFYEQRIEAIEVEVVGLLADSPLRGTLTAGGVTRFRKRDGSLGERAHVIDTMVLSDFQLRNDLFVYTTDTGIRGLFQGLGLGGSWVLHLPRRSNDNDLNRIFDIRLVFYYKAKFDSVLRDSVLVRPVRPGEMRLQRNWSMRFDFPARWYSFYQNGGATFDISKQRLPSNQRSFQTAAVLLRVLLVAGVNPEGINLRVVSPNGTEIVATTDARGIISTNEPSLSGLVKIDPVGEWEVHVEGGAPLDNGEGGIDFSKVQNIQFSMDYGFEYLPETGLDDGSWLVSNV